MLFTYCLFLFAMSSVGQDLIRTNSVTQDSAITLAVSYLGVQPKIRTTTSATASAVMARLEECSYEFQREFLGLDVWSITLSSVPLPWRSSDSQYQALTDTITTKDFEVTLDASSGKLIRIISHYQPTRLEDTTSPWQRPPNHGISARGFEISVPSEPPEFGLLEAIARRAALDPRHARKIEATLVTMDWSQSGKRPFLSPEDGVPVWQVIFKYLDEDVRATNNEIDVLIRGTKQFYQTIDLSTDEPRGTCDVSTGSLRLR